jgi:hypothetical protein
MLHYQDRLTIIMRQAGQYFHKHAAGCRVRVAFLLFIDGSILTGKLACPFDARPTAAVPFAMRILKQGKTAVQPDV